jgi:predicted enzyme related to lactoylglutathione lyase
MMAAARPSSSTSSTVSVDDIGQAHEALAARGVMFRSQPHKIATLADREVWLADFEDSEGNVLALMSEPRLTQ